MQRTLIAGLLLSLLAAIGVALAPGRTARPAELRPDRGAIESSTRAPSPAPSTPRTVPRRAVEAASDQRGDAQDMQPALRTGASLSLHVVDAVTGRALPDFDLALRQDSVELVARTDPRGDVVTGAVWSTGTVSVGHRADPEIPLHAASWNLDPSSLRIGPDTARIELTLRARRPAIHLTVQVFAPDGHALEGAEVVLVHGWRDARRRFLSEWTRTESTDASGTARFPVFEDDATETAVLLWARHRTSDLASRVVSFDAPLQPGPWAIPLQPCGSVRVSAHGRDGLPLARGTAVVTSTASAHRAMSHAAARVSGGSCRLEHLGPGSYLVRVHDEGSSDSREVSVDVAAGRESLAILRFDDGVSAVAASGLVVDEDGAPLAGAHVWCDAPLQASVRAVTAGDGRFEFVRERTSTVVIGTEGDVSNDGFAPSRIEVPFGTSDLVLRRVARSTRCGVSFEVVDADTGSPPEAGGGVYLLRGKPRAEGGWRWEALSAGRAEVDVDWREGTRYRVSCAGYRSVERELTRPLQPGVPVRVALERGFRHSLSVVDALTREPLVEVRIHDADGVVDARTDALGCARLEARAWPTRLRVERAGYLASSIQLEDLESVHGVVALEPAVPDPQSSRRTSGEPSTAPGERLLLVR